MTFLRQKIISDTSVILLYYLSIIKFVLKNVSLYYNLKPLKKKKYIYNKINIIKKLLSKYIQANLIVHFIDNKFYIQCFKTFHTLCIYSA